MSKKRFFVHNFFSKINFDHFLTLHFLYKFEIFEYFVVVKKRLKINFREKFNLTDPIIFASLREITTRYFFIEKMAQKKSFFGNNF